MIKELLTSPWFWIGIVSGWLTQYLYHIWRSEMTEDEFKKKAWNLMVELNKPSKKYNIFIFVTDITTGNGFNFGFGCPGCAVEAINQVKDAGELPHHDDKIGIH